MKGLEVVELLNVRLTAFQKYVRTRRVRCPLHFIHFPCHRNVTSILASPPPLTPGPAFLDALNSPTARCCFDFSLNFERTTKLKFSRKHCDHRLDQTKRHPRAARNLTIVPSAQLISIMIISSTINSTHSANVPVAVLSLANPNDGVVGAERFFVKVEEDWDVRLHTSIII